MFLPSWVFFLFVMSERRQAEASRIREKYPDRVPVRVFTCSVHYCISEYTPRISPFNRECALQVIVEKAENSDVPVIDKKKSVTSSLAAYELLVLDMFSFLDLEPSLSMTKDILLNIVCRRINSCPVSSIVIGIRSQEFFQLTMFICEFLCCWIQVPCTGGFNSGAVCVCCPQKNFVFVKNTLPPTGKKSSLSFIIV